MFPRSERQSSIPPSFSQLGFKSSPCTRNNARPFLPTPPAFLQKYYPYKHRSFFSFIRSLYRRRIIITLSSFSPTSSMPDVSPPSHHAFGRCRWPVNGGPHVEVEDGLACGFWRARVVVYHVTNFAYGAVRGLALDVPVVAVKGGFAAVSLRILASCSESRMQGSIKKMVIDLGGGK